MAMYLRLVLLMVGAAASCADVGNCVDEELWDGRHEVSLLQTDVHVAKHSGQTHSIKSYTEKKSDLEKKSSAGIASKDSSTKESGGGRRTIMQDGPAPGWLIVALVLLGFAAFIASGKKDEEPAETRAKHVSEFLGTFMLVFSVGLNVLVGDKVWGVTSIACTLMVMIYALATVSGANFNPAVSVALGLSYKMPWEQVVSYVLTQLAAGLSAGMCYKSLLGQSFGLAPEPGFTLFQAAVAEMLYTFMLTFVVLNTAASKSTCPNQYYGLAIGFTVVAGGYGAGSISEGCFNPAISLAIDAASPASSGFGNCFAYFLAEAIGCFFAAAFFRVVRPAEFDDVSEPTETSSTTSKLVSEFLGTYMLVLTVGLNVLNNSKAGAFSIAASLMCMIFALGSVSGAHFNPAVTFAIFCKGDIAPSEAVKYVISQLGAGILAAFTYESLMTGQVVALAPKTTPSQAYIGELVFTFLLCYVVLCVATVKNPLSQFFGLAIGACVIVGGDAIGSLSGGSLNPAVSAGLAISDTLHGGGHDYFFHYAVVELFAGGAAAAVFHITHGPSEKKKMIG